MSSQSYPYERKGRSTYVAKKSSGSLSRVKDFRSPSSPKRCSFVAELSRDRSLRMDMAGFGGTNADVAIKVNAIAARKVKKAFDMFGLR
jgi:hypothetical protein